MRATWVLAAIIVMALTVAGMLFKLSDASGVQPAPLAASSEPVVTIPLVRSTAATVPDYLTVSGTIDPGDPRIAHLAVPEASATKISLGQGVELESVDRPGEIVRAAITRIGEVSPRSRTLTVEVAVPTGAGIPAGVLVEGRIATTTRELPQVPRTAIARRGAGWRLWVAKDGVLAERVVQPGPASSPTHVTIVRGLAAGEDVAAVAGDGVTDGARLR